MACILDTDTNRTHPLRAHHTLGRSVDAVDTTLTSASASRIHAVFEWNGFNWLVRDLSRNGTWLESNQLPVRQSVPVALGQRIYFGSPNSTPWKFIDDSAPQSLLLGSSPGAPSLVLEPYVFLPSEADPQIVISYSRRQKTWVQSLLSQVGETAQGEPLSHGSALVCSGQRWQVFLAESADATEIHPCPEKQLNEFEFIFDLSLDEENTELRLANEEFTVNLGERSHHYLLLHLARTRAEQAKDGLDMKSQGWVNTEQLTKEMGVDMSHINILIYRAKQQLSRQVQTALDLDALVERGRGRVRFGCSRFRIYKGQELTYRLPLADIAQPV